MPRPAGYRLQASNGVTPSRFDAAMSDSPVTRLEAFAATRYGVFTLADAADHVVSARMIETRVASARWTRVLPRVFRVTAVPITFRQRALAATLWSRGHASHLTGAQLWALHRTTTRSLAVIVSRDRDPRHPGVIVHRAENLLPADLTSIHGIAVTSALRTVLDLAALLDPLALELVIEDALRRQLFTLGQLRWRADEYCGMGVAGSTLLREMLDHRLGDTDSGWELRIARILTAAGFPEPKRQVQVTTIDGPKFLDLGYAGSPPIALEYDSDLWHFGVRRRHLDAARRNALRLAGVTVIEITSDLAADPERLIKLIGPAIQHLDVAS